MRPSPTTRAGRRGNSLIETAMVLPMMILLIIAVLDYGLFLLERHLINDLARDGAHQAAISTKRGINLPTQLQTRLQSLPGAGLLSNSQVTVYKTNGSGVQIAGSGGLWTSAQFGEPIAVEVRANYNPILRAVGLINGVVVTILPTTGTPRATPLKAKCITMSEFD